jgi:DNA-binding NtrC family response regulator
MKPKILIVDDDVAITQQLFWTLCEEFEVMTANNLSSAIRRATAYEPDVSILDLHLPPTPDTPDTGLRILDYVKRHLPSSKVFVASTDSSLEVRRELARLGADGFLTKPLDAERLLSTIRRAAFGPGSRSPEDRRPLFETSPSLRPLALP